jgi:hypothetical protein
MSELISSRNLHTNSRLRLTLQKKIVWDIGVAASTLVLRYFHYASLTSFPYFKDVELPKYLGVILKTLNDFRKTPQPIFNLSKSRRYE